MALPCEQESNIVHITKTLDRMEKAQDRVVDMLEKVANQGARIASLEKQVDENTDNLNVLFDRVRQLERNDAAIGPELKLALHETLEVLTAKTEEIKVFMNMIHSKPFLIVLGAIGSLICVGTIIDVAYHAEFMGKVWHFVRG